MNEALHQQLMRRALTLAGRGRTSPNPQVGALVVNQGHIVGQGYHRRCGAAHAETVALAQAGEAARGADLYVTLEPCNHHGRTPPCTEAIEAAGIRRVFIGYSDPDPRVKGGGAVRLAEAGLELRTGIAGAECEAFYEAYSVHRRAGRPHVTVKAAMTLDGRLATRTGDSRWVTGPEARRDVHRLRHRVDAILVGVGTVLADDPQLTTRLARGQGHDPVRVILDTHGRTPLQAQVVVHASASPTLIAHGLDGAEAVARLAGTGVVPLPCQVRDGRIDLADLLHQLGERGIVTLLVEGGGEVHGAFFEAGLVDRVMFFVAPRIVGGRQAIPAVGGRGVEKMSDAYPVHGVRVRRVGQDFLFEGRVVAADLGREEERS